MPMSDFEMPVENIDLAATRSSSERTPRTGRLPGWKPPSLLVLFLGLFAAGWIVSCAVQVLEKHRVVRDLERVTHDWASLRKAIASLGVDWCCQLPLDTSHRGDTRPTFNDDLPTYEALSDKGGPPLTTPVAYIDRIPDDPFGGGSYGYLMWSQGHGEPGIYVLHSPGPDGDEDVSLGRLHALIGETFVRYEHEMPPHYTDRSAARARAIVSRFLYDPTNGTLGDGDLIRVDAISAGGIREDLVGWAAPEPRPASGDASEPPDGWVEEMLRKHPPDTSLPAPRWKGPGPASASIDPVDYRRFADILLSDPLDSGSPLARIETELRAFSEFFERPGALNESERLAFAKWRIDGAEWWVRVEAASGLSGDLDPRTSAGRRSVLSVEALARLESVRGKSLLLLAADALRRGDAADFERRLSLVEKGPVFTGKSWSYSGERFEPDAPAVWEAILRIQADLRRMNGDLREHAPPP